TSSCPFNAATSPWARSANNCSSVRRSQPIVSTILPKRVSRRFASTNCSLNLVEPHKVTTRGRACLSLFSMLFLPPLLLGRVDQPARQPAQPAVQPPPHP